MIEAFQLAELVRIAQITRRDFETLVEISLTSDSVATVTESVVVYVAEQSLPDETTFVEIVGALQELRANVLWAHYFNLLVAHMGFLLSNDWSKPRYKVGDTLNASLIVDWVRSHHPIPSRAAFPWVEGLEIPEYNVPLTQRLHSPAKGDWVVGLGVVVAADPEEVLAIYRVHSGEFYFFSKNYAGGGR